MTNFDCQRLRIALAEGLCVTDLNNQILRWDGWGFQCWHVDAVSGIGDWRRTVTIYFAPSSRIVPEPDNFNFICPVCRTWNYCPEGKVGFVCENHCSQEIQKPQSISFDEAMQAEAGVHIYYPKWESWGLPNTFRKNQGRYTPVDIACIYSAIQLVYRVTEAE